MTVAEPTVRRRRVRARVEGVVQGVGFRPFAWRLARDVGVAGFVRNDAEGVVLEVEGDERAVDRFLARLAAEAPPLAAVERVLPRDVPTTGARTFCILDSAAAGDAGALVTADTATCDECLAELFDPQDRRYRYPFVNCTNCGPRFTIVCGVPYDRPLTTMAGFRMCERCAAEYADPADRRFHAQPNACPACGPRARLVPGPDEGDPIALAAAALHDGAIVAMKGVGGFHLACLASDEAAVARLRARKHREEKPFALMAPTLDAARTLVDLGTQEAALLRGRDRPIVLCGRRRHAPVAAAVAPGSRELGVMLPYSPLHHLLLADAGVALVLTSGNRSDEPIAYRDDDARERLAGIADLFLVHDRPIRTRTDDSVVRLARRRPLMLRRSRGLVPSALALPMASSREILAVGAELKSTFCLARGRRAWVGHHIGDLQDYETLRSFQEGIAHFQHLFTLRPDVIAHDLHPDYLSTRYALERAATTQVAVQHHHAHLAACLAEHGESGPVVGAIFDGAGLGTDGTVWGGEVLVGDLRGFERAGHLWPVRLPGGDRAVREPWRMACAWLAEADGVAEPAIPPALVHRVDPERWRAVARLVATGVAAPVTSSVGRLFDAVAALCGLRVHVSYEGQAACELEGACDPSERGTYPMPQCDGGVLDARETIRAVTRDLGGGAPPAIVAARFHHALADGAADACAGIAGSRGVGTVVLSGGAFQNRRLLERAGERLERAGLRVLVPERLPPNDGGISFGQAAIAAAGVSP